MKLVELITENFRGLRDGKYSFVHPTSGAPLPVVLIAGGPSSGKTSLLQAIIALKESVGSYHVRPDPASLRRFGAQSGRLRGTWLLTEDEMARADLATPTFVADVSLESGAVRAPEPAVEEVFKTYRADPMMGKFEYYPCNRQLAPRLGHAPASESASAHVRLGRDADKYAGLERELLRIAVGDGLGTLAQVDSDGILMKGDLRDSLAVHRAAIRALCPRIALRRVEAAAQGAAVWFQRESGAVVELYDLSASEQQAVLFAVTFHLFGLNRSVLLIDEPELHIHPADHVRFLGALAALGQEGQIIATTASAPILAAAARHQVITLGTEAP